MEEADVADDFRLDPLLAEACDPIVRTACKNVKPGEGRYVSCG